MVRPEGVHPSGLVATTLTRRAMTMAKRNCSMPGCPRPHKAHGLCGTHLYRSAKGLNPTAPVRQYERGGVCKLEGCDEPRSRGTTGSADYCPMHRMRAQRDGSVRGPDRERASAGEAIWNVPEYRRRYRWLKDYGLTPEEFDTLLASQDGRCAICRSETPKSRRNGTWCVDHDHETGRIRGLLCTACNRALGLFGDDLVVLEAA